MKTLVTILNHNLPKETMRLYNLLSKHEKDIYKTIIIDNGSEEDGTPDVCHHKFKKNVFFTGGLNYAFDLVLNSKEYDSLLFLNNDLLVFPNNFVKELRRVSFELNYDLVSPSIMTIFNDYPAWRQMANWGVPTPRDCEWIDFQAPFFKRELIEEIKSFPDELVYGWGCDFLSAFKCQDLDMKICVVDWVCALHYESLTLRSNACKISLKTYNSIAGEALEQYMVKTKQLDRMRSLESWARSYNND